MYSRSSKDGVWVYPASTLPDLLKKSTMAREEKYVIIDSSFNTNTYIFT